MSPLPSQDAAAQRAWVWSDRAHWGWQLELAGKVLRYHAAGHVDGHDWQSRTCHAVPRADQEDRGQGGAELDVLPTAEALPRLQDLLERLLRVRGPVLARTVVALSRSTGFVWEQW